MSSNNRRGKGLQPMIDNAQRIIRGRTAHLDIMDEMVDNQLQQPIGAFMPPDVNAQYLEYLRQLGENNPNMSLAPSREIRAWPLHEYSYTPPQRTNENRDLYNEFFAPGVVDDAVRRWRERYENNISNGTNAIKEPNSQIFDLATLYARLYDYIYQHNARNTAKNCCKNKEVLKAYADQYPQQLMVDSLDEMKRVRILECYHQLDVETGMGTMYWIVIKDLYATT